MGTQTTQSMESAVRQRYSGGAKQRENDLCCPASYDPKLLEILPKEILEKDYGCGDPTPYLRRGEIVVDLGCGAGKICYLAAQMVGPSGKVIGLDMNDDMLEIARRYRGEVTERLGYDNVEFRKARIQDLRTDRDWIDRWLTRHPIRNERDLVELESYVERLRQEAPLLADGSVDVVVSSCVLNLVDAADKPRLFEEIHRVLKNGGRAVISDIVSDEPVPVEMQRDPLLWSGCISGALQEQEFLNAFERAGFYGVTLARRQSAAWKTIQGIEFRSVLVLAYRGKEGECWDHKDAVIYRGPFREVLDDDGHRYRRGTRVAVCRKTFSLLAREPYSGHFEAVPPRVEVSAEQAVPFACSAGTRLRSPRETKGEDYTLTEDSASSCCEPGQCC